MSFVKLVGWDYHQMWFSSVWAKFRTNRQPEICCSPLSGSSFWQPWSQEVNIPFLKTTHWQSGSQKLDFTFIQVQVSDNHGVRKWTFFSSKQPSDNQAVGNWMFWSGTTAQFTVRLITPTIMMSRTWKPTSFLTTVSDKHAVRVSTGFCKALILKGLLLRSIYRSLRSAAFDCHESQIYRGTATFVDPSKWQVLG